MKKSLQELFQVDHPTLFLEFGSKPTHTAYRWALTRIQQLIDESLNSEDPFSLEESDKRRYLCNAQRHYQGNYDELVKMQNTALREEKVEPQLVDLISTIA